jgi:hypothetical protein
MRRYKGCASIYCQGEDRGFESRRPLKMETRVAAAALPLFGRF